MHQIAQPPMNPSVYILIPVHNRKAVTLTCLETLQRHGDLDRYHIVVIDDGSTDGTAEAIQQAFPHVKILAGNGNLWWTGAMCLGMEYAVQQDCEAVIWLNDDCPPTPGSLAAMYQASQQQGNAMIGAACYIAETHTLKPTGAKGRTPMYAHPGDLVPVDEMSGYCVYIPRAVMVKIGLPDMRRFPHYYGDSSYSLHATRSGFPAYLLGDAKVMNIGKANAQSGDFYNSDLASYKYTFNQVFLSRGSIYYWPTQYFYNIEKYGRFKGTGLFFLKTLRWFTRWTWLSVKWQNSHV